MVADIKKRTASQPGAFLLKSRQPVSFARIRESVVGYRDERENRASLERRFERDKAALRELGVPLKFVTEDEPGGPDT